MEKLAKIYTQENIVSSKGVANADTTIPVNVYTDNTGNHVLADGNHRAVRALTEGQLDALPRYVIGHIDRNISGDPNYKPISDVKVV